MFVQVKQHPNFSNILVYSNGFIYRKDKGEFAKKTLSNGYHRISILADSYALHRLVYEAFVGPIPSGMEINHLDGCKINNDIGNLQLVTRSENMIHAFANGICINKVTGQRHGMSKHSDEERDAIKLMLKLKVLKCSEIAKDLGVSVHLVYKLKSRLKSSGDL